MRRLLALNAAAVRVLHSGKEIAGQIKEGTVLLGLTMAADAASPFADAFHLSTPGRQGNGMGVAQPIRTLKTWRGIPFGPLLAILGNAWPCKPGTCVFDVLPAGLDPHKHPSTL
jgi:hypothetical protein